MIKENLTRKNSLFQFRNVFPDCVQCRAVIPKELQGYWVGYTGLTLAQGYKSFYRYSCIFYVLVEKHGISCYETKSNTKSCKTIFLPLFGFAFRRAIVTILEIGGRFYLSGKFYYYFI